MDPNQISPSNISSLTIDKLRVSTMTLTAFTNIGKIHLDEVYGAIIVKGATRTVGNKRVGENIGDIVSKSYAGKCKGLAEERKKAKKKPVTETDYTHRGNKGAFGNAVDISITDGNSNVNIKIFCNGTLSCVGGTSVDQGLRLLCRTYGIIKSIDGAIENEPRKKYRNGKIYGIVELGVRVDMRNHNLTPTQPVNINRLIECTKDIEEKGEELPFRIDFNNVINATLNATWKNSSTVFKREHYHHTLMYWNTENRNSKVKYKIVKNSSKLPDSLMKPKDKHPIRFVIFPNGNSPIIFTGNIPLEEMKNALADFVDLMIKYYAFPGKDKDKNIPEPNIKLMRKKNIYYI